MSYQPDISVKTIIIVMAVFGGVMIGMSQFYVAGAQIYGADYQDVSYFNKTAELQARMSEMDAAQNQSADTADISSSDFSFAQRVTGSLAMLGTILNTPTLIMDTTNEISDQTGIVPDWLIPIVGIVVSIIFFMWLLAVVMRAPIT